MWFLQVTYMSCLKPTFFGDLVCWCDTLDVLSESGQQARRTWSEKPLWMSVTKYYKLRCLFMHHFHCQRWVCNCRQVSNQTSGNDSRSQSISRRKTWQLCRTRLDVNGLAIKSLLWNHGHYQLWGYLAFDLRSKRSNWCWSSELLQCINGKNMCCVMASFLVV